MEAKYVGALGTIAFYADCFADDPAREGQVREMRDAYAAVAELVEAASNPVILEGATDGNWQIRMEAIQRLRAALSAAKE